MNKRRLLIVIGIVVVVVLVIVFDTILGNHRPVVTSLEAPARVVPSGSCQIVVNASDRDRDVLSYNWSASGGEINGEGATVTWVAPNFVGSYNLTVTVIDGRGGEVMKQVTIEVRANESPAISSLVADVDWTLPSGTLRVTCTASDADGDQLSYEWTATAGHISGTGDAVNWTAPAEVGMYSVTVEVEDGHGSSVTRLLPVSVAAEQPPVIEELRVTAEHCYLKTYPWGCKVGKEQAYHIECILADNSSVASYNWLCDGGGILGEGSVITWTAPNASVEVTVTVIVSDITGNMAVKNVVLNVVPCSRCEFGC